MKIIKDENSAVVMAIKLSEIIGAAIKSKGYARLVISGGSTPKQMLIKLFSIKLDWHKVTLYFSDERYVPISHKDSNHKMVNECMQQAELTTNLPTLVNYYYATSNIDAAVEILEIKLSQIVSFDAVVIGMGLDGHFASLFPDDADLQQKLSLNNRKNCCQVSTESSPYARISLTLSCLLRTDNFFLLIAGDEKLKVLNNAKKGLDDPKFKVPISALYQSEIPKNKIQVYCQLT